MAEENEKIKMENSEEEVEDDRQRWSNKTEFILSLIGFSVGLGNIWRFPFLCYKNGGGAFLIPYFIFLFVCGIPMFFLELSLGQFMSRGGIAAWGISPIMQGIGFASTVIVSYLNLYYVVVLAWGIYYLYQSFTFDHLPWSQCDQPWNTPDCFSYLHTDNSTVLTHHVTSAEEYWNWFVLQKSESVYDVGGIRPGLLIALAISWVLVYLCIWKGVKVTGKIVWFTALFPYFTLAVLLVRGLSLPGAWDGVVFYLSPDPKELLSSEVWIDAGTQIFFSYSIGIGGLIALGSYNHFKNDCLKDALIFTGVNSCTSLIGGLAIFSILGHLSHIMGVSVDSVAEQGPGLVFIVYPEAVTLLPFSNIWAILFFLMIIILGIDSEFVGVEGFVTSVMDSMPHYFKFKHSREMFVGAVCFIKFLIGIIFVTNGGIYVFEIFDKYSASGICLLIIAAFECIAIGWVYGAQRYSDDIEVMIGYPTPKYFEICWKFVTPFFTLAILAYSLLSDNEDKVLDDHHFPPSIHFVGYILALSSVSCIPIIAGYRYFTTEGTHSEKMSRLLAPLLFKTQIHEKTRVPYALAANKYTTTETAVFYNA